MVSSPADGSIDYEVMNHGFGRNGNRPCHHAKSDGDLPRHAEPPLENDNRHNTHRN